MSQGICFGFEVISTLNLEYLRPGGGAPALMIDEHDGSWKADSEDVLVDWEPREGRPTHVRLHAIPSGYGLWISDAGWFKVDVANRQITVPPTDSPLRREERLWGMPSLLSFLDRGDMPLHAGAVEIDKSVVLFGGPTRHGKTTLAASLHNSGLRLMSEDLSCITPGLEVVPGPTMIRLRHDMAEALDINNTRLLGRDEERTHLAMIGAETSDPRPAPLGAIVLLNTADEISVSRIDPMEALPDLWILTFHLPIESHTRWLFDRVASIAEQVPVYSLSRPLRLDALPATIEAMKEIGSSVGT